MNLNPWSMLFHAINALILVVAFKYWMYKPVRRFIDARTTKIRAEREEIETTKAQIISEEAAARAELDSARVQATKTLQDSHARFELEKAELLKQARAEATAVVDEARQRADDILSRSQDEIRAEAADLAILIAEKLLSREVTKEDNRKMIDRFLAETE